MLNFSLLLIGFRSIIHPYWEYLLKLDEGKTCFNNNQVNVSPDRYVNPAGAILCKKSARRLEV
jgi:hypothetical protein